jgi:hypothetical protein
MELYGWDIVYGASVSIINQQLAQASEGVLTTFSYSRTDTDFTVDLAGRFGTWAVTGGSNSLIDITMPIGQGSLTLTGDAATALLAGTSYQPGQTIDLAGVAVTVSLPLSFRPSAQDASQQALTFAFATTGDDSAAAADIILKTLTDPHQTLPGTSLPGLFRQAFGELLTANRQRLSYEFAHVMSSGAANSWATPTYLTFYYAQPQNSPTAFFTMLAMAYRPNADGISPKIDPLLCSYAGADRCLALSRDVLLHGLIQPGLPHAIDTAIGATPQAVPVSNTVDGTIRAGLPSLNLLNSPPPTTTAPTVTPADSFQYDFDNHIITGQGISLSDPDQSGPISDETFMTMQVQVADDAFQTTIDISSTINDEVDVQFHGSFQNRVVFDSQHNQFVTLPDPNPVLTHQASLDPNADPWAVLSGGVGSLTDLGVAAIVLPLLMNTGFDNFSRQIQLNTFQNLPLSWAGLGQQFTVLEAALSGNVYVLGTSE